MPILLAFLVMEVFVLVQPLSGGTVNVAALLLLAPPFLIVAWHFSNLARDLRAQPVVSEGEVRRKWSRIDLPFVRSYYLYVGKTVYRIPANAWTRLEQGDRVSITHLPHTATVERLELITGGVKGKGR